MLVRAPLHFASPIAPHLSEYYLLLNARDAYRKLLAEDSQNQATNARVLSLLEDALQIYDGVHSSLLLDLFHMRSIQALLLFRRIGRCIA